MSKTILAALIGGLAGAAVTGIVAVINGWRERKSHRQELLVTSAVKLAALRIESGIKVMELTRQEAVMIDAVLLTHAYYRQLLDLLDKGTLPEDAFRELDDDEYFAVTGKRRTAKSSSN